MRDIDYDAILDFAEKQREQGLSAASVNRSLAALHRMFRLAANAGKVRSIPAFPERLDESDSIRQGFIEPKDFEPVVSALPDYLKLPFAIAFFGGMRRNEVASLVWSNIDFLNDEIRLTPVQAKN